MLGLATAGGIVGGALFAQSDDTDSVTTGHVAVQDAGQDDGDTAVDDGRREQARGTERLRGTAQPGQVPDTVAPTTTTTAAPNTTTTVPATTTTTTTVPDTTAPPATAPATTAPPATAPPTTSPPATSPPTTAAPTTTTTAPPAPDRDPAPTRHANRYVACENYMFDAINDARADAGVAAVGFDTGIQYIAVDWSDDMAGTQTLAHNPHYAQEMAQVRSYSYAAENVGRSTDLEILFQAFMDSPGHRRNIEAAAFSWVTVGCVIEDGGQIWVTQNFWG